MKYPGTCYAVRPLNPDSTSDSHFTTTEGDFNFEIEQRGLDQLEALRAGRAGKRLLVTVQVTEPPLGGGRLLPSYEAFFLDNVVYGTAIVTIPNASRPGGATAAQGDTLTIDVLRD